MELSRAPAHHPPLQTLHPHHSHTHLQPLPLPLPLPFPGHTLHSQQLPLHTQQSRRLSISLARSLGSSFGRSLGETHHFQFAMHMQSDCHADALEDHFCRDFACCGLLLNNLHELLHHYEEAHVRGLCASDDDEDDGDDLWLGVRMDGDDLPFGFDADTQMMDLSQDSKAAPVGSSFPGLAPPPAATLSEALMHSHISHLATAHPCLSNQTAHITVAPLTVSHYPYSHNPHSVPTISDGPNHSHPQHTPIAKTIKADVAAQDPETYSSSEDGKDDRPYKCPHAGCPKTYKNPGGLKYHLQHGHFEDTGDPERNDIMMRPYTCSFPTCSKRYKNLNGLKVLFLFYYVHFFTICPTLHR